MLYLKEKHIWLCFSTWFTECNPDKIMSSAGGGLVEVTYGCNKQRSSHYLETNFGRRKLKETQWPYRRGKMWRSLQEFFSTEYVDFILLPASIGHVGFLKAESR